MLDKWLKGAQASASVTIMLGFAVLAVAPQAKAGFEWTPPPSRQAAPPIVAAPAMAVESEDLGAPVPLPEIDSFPLQRAPARQVPEAMMKSQPQEPIDAQPSPHSAYMPPPVMSAPANPVFAEAVGFGNDIPLVLAMRQIVPPEFSYSFDQGVNPGARISWSGGKPWDEALADAVRPLDLNVVVSGNTVWLRPTWQNAPAEKTRVSSMPAPVPMSEPVRAVRQPVPSMPPADPFAISPTPLPLSISPPAAQEREPRQSYPRRQRPDMGHYQDEAPSSIMAEAEDTSARPSGPIPLMKALPPPPAEPDLAQPPRPVADFDVAPSAVISSVQPPVMGSDAGGRTSVMDPFEIRFWQAEAGASLKEVLNRWSAAANVAMLWNAPYDYTVVAPVKAHATFPDAVTSLLASYNGADPRPLGRLHPNLPGGPSVLVIENYSSATN